jgi:hypothetical protein
MLLERPKRRNSVTFWDGDDLRVRTIEGNTTVRQNVGRTLWGLTTEVMVKILRIC